MLNRVSLLGPRSAAAVWFLGIGMAVACGASQSSTFPNGTRDGGSNDGGMMGTGDGGRFGGGDGGEAGSGVTALYFQPASATVTVNGAGTQTASYTLEAKLATGQTVAVSPESLEFDRPDLASIANGNPVVATAPSALGLYGGTGTLHAIYGGVEAVATLTVNVALVDYGTGLGPTSPAVMALGAGNLPADPAPGITPLLYPYNGTVWPLGLTSPPVMWNAPQAGDVYRMHYAETFYTFDGYYTLAALPGQLRLAQADWDRITASNNAQVGADPLSFTLSRWDNVSGLAYSTGAETWTIAPESLRGAIYYWTTSNGGSLSRIPPGAGAVPQAIAGPNGNNCMGCHAVSADGSTLVAGVRGEPAMDNPGDDRAWTSFNLPSATVREVSTLFSGNLAISPDGTYVVSGDETLKLSSSSTGTVIANSGLSSVTLDTNMTGLTTPAFSPDGTLLAAIEQGGNDWQYWDYSLTPDSELVLLSFDKATTTFTTAPVKLTDGSQFTAGQQTINYPSFSPDSKWVAFQVADHASGCWIYPSGCQTTTTESGAIFLASTTPGMAPLRLTNLSDPETMTDPDLSLEPTFNPVARGGYFWLVFTSERGWGNDTDVSGPADNNKKRLWVSAIDPTIGTTDPSHPAFFLEGQDTTTQNMRGFWTLSQCIATPGAGGGDAGVADAASSDAGAADGGTTCVNGFDCCSGFCANGQCININQLSCAGVGGSCTTASDCCNSDVVQCTNGVCTVPTVQ